MTLLHWLSFVGLWTLASVALGPNAVNCALVSARFGAGRAVWAIAGILAASVVYQTLVFGGVAAVLMAAATLFTALKLVGCAYIFHIGVQTCRNGAVPAGPPLADDAARFHLARDAFLIALANPKSILSYLAIFSPFIVPGHVLDQAMILAPTALAITLLAYGGYALIGAPLGRVTTSARRLRLVNRLAGSFFIASAAAVAANELRR